MRLIIRHSGIHSAKKMDSNVSTQIRTLEPLRLIDQATVLLAREHETSPPFRIHVHLVTPGPDVFAEARDHTLQAALSKVMKQLMSEIGSRAGKRHARLRDNIQTPTPKRPARAPRPAASRSIQ